MWDDTRSLAVDGHVNSQEGVECQAGRGMGHVHHREQGQVGSHLLIRPSYVIAAY